MNQRLLIALDGPQTVAFLIAVVVCPAVMFVVMAVMFSKFYRKVGAEEAIVRTGHGCFKAATGSGIWVVPILHRAEQIDLSVKRIGVTRSGESAVTCQDGGRADIEAAFLIRINNTFDDILTVAQSLGCRRASDPNTVTELFQPGFSEAICKAAAGFTFSQIADDPESFKQEVFNLIEPELNGFVLDNVSFTRLDRTRSENFDPLNILVGQTCEITAPHSTNSPGQARHVPTDAAPLQLDFSSTDSSLAEGDRAVIVGFAEEQQTYVVEKQITR